MGISIVDCIQSCFFFLKIAIFQNIFKGIKHLFMCDFTCDMSGIFAVDQMLQMDTSIMFCVS